MNQNAKNIEKKIALVEKYTVSEKVKRNVQSINKTEKIYI